MAERSVEIFVEALREQGVDENSLNRILEAESIQEAQSIAVTEGVGPVIVGVALDQVPEIQEADEEAGSPEVIAELEATQEAARLSRLSPRERDRESKEPMLRQYQEAGVDAQLLWSEDDEEHLIVSVDPQTGQTLEWDMEEFNEDPVAVGRLGQDPFGRLTELDIPPPPPEEDDRAYLFGLSPDQYTVDVPVEQYMAMLRWLDPDTETRLEDQELVAEMFSTERRDETGRLLRSEFAFMAQANPAIANDPRFAREFGADTVSVGPKYVAGQEHSLFQGKSPEWVASVQAQLVQGGLLDATDIQHEGVWGLAEANVMASTVMPLADARGQAWQSVLRDFAENPLPDPPKPAFVKPVYMAPDTATLSQEVKRMMRSRLGREPEPWEMEDLIRQMETDHFSDYQAQVEAARIEWNARTSAEEAGAAGQSTVGGGTVQGVDPFARMQERFDQLYQPEIDRNEAVTAQRADVSTLARSLGGIQNIVEAGGLEP